ncbi:MAG: zinc ribbon domain-containing protein [Thermococcus sp.]|uniref:zinc ribbon domain-containing protein n=1 Tax=Thermococcus sp. TaxID=35749 RepID=UPI001D79A998|nr:zinc ribbon domain-containing protein [Thermococcus sp.]MBO8175569.1 zinc ribbon domain-containing protein [Thermococcus sp.]
MPHNFKFCPYCGGELRGDFRFCPYCGASLEIEKEPKREELPSENSKAEAKIVPQTAIETPKPSEKEVEESERGFSLRDIPPGKPVSKERKHKVEVIGVGKKKFSKELVFDGSKGTKFGKLKLDEALELFEKIPKTYPRPLSEKDNLIVFKADSLRIIVLPVEGARKYRITCVGVISIELIGFTILEEATYEEAVEAIRRFYLEDDFIKNAYRAKEKYLEEKEVAEGKYILKIPGVFRRYDIDEKVASVLYLTDKGFHFYAHDGVYYSMEMPEDLPYFTREGIQRIKFNKKYTEMEITYVDPEGKKGTFSFAFLLPEEGMRYYQTLSSEFPGRVKVKGGWFG